MSERGTLALSWSGGKDSALALWALTEERDVPTALLVTVTEDYGRVSMHGVRRSLLRQQAAATGLSLVEVEIPADCTNDLYESRMAAAFASSELSEVDEVAFGDLFLEDIRAYRESRLGAAGKRARFPIWGRDTATLARRFLAAGFRAILVCVDPRKLDSSFAGRDYDERLLADLPASVDPCGENGEFHTFVTAGPVLDRPIDCRRGEVVERQGFVFCDLLDNG
ncbi:MAG: ATP-binding protein [Gaiellaceae bacterium]